MSTNSLHDDNEDQEQASSSRERGLTASISVSSNSLHDDEKDQERTSSSREKGNQLESHTHPEYGMVIGIGMYLSDTPQTV